MTPQPNHKQIDEEGQARLQELVKERLQMAIKLTLIEVLEAEISTYMNCLLTSSPKGNYLHRDPTHI